MKIILFKNINVRCCVAWLTYCVLTGLYTKESREHVVVVVNGSKRPIFILILLFESLVLYKFHPTTHSWTGGGRLFSLLYFLCVWEIHHLIFFIVSPSTCSNDDMHQLFTFFPFVVSCPAITLQYIETQNSSSIHYISLYCVCRRVTTLLQSSAYYSHTTSEKERRKTNKNQRNGLMKLGYRKWPALLLV